MYMYNKVPKKHPRQETDEIIPEYLQYLYETETYKLILDLRKGQIRTVALRAHSGNYVSAVNGGGDLLLANKDNVGEFEVFSLIPMGIQEGNIAIRTYRGYFFSAPGGGGASLNASKTYIGPDELFQIIPLYPESIAIRTRNGHYVVAEEPSNLLRTNRLAIGDWERFDIVPVDISQRIWIY
jgi:hypothetical protein